MKEAILIFLISLNLVLGYMLWQRTRSAESCREVAVELAHTLDQQRELIDTINARQKRLALALRNATLVTGVKK